MNASMKSCGSNELGNGHSVLTFDLAFVATTLRRSPWQGMDILSSDVIWSHQLVALISRSVSWHFPSRSSQALHLVVTGNGRNEKSVIMATTR